MRNNYLKFWDAITLIENRGEAIAFLKDLLTPTEVKMLAKGYKYEDIKTHVRVTVQTISHMNNKLNYGEYGLIKILQKLEKIDHSKQDRLVGTSRI